MAALTLGCAVALVWPPALQIGLGAIAVGTLLTIALRLVRLSKALRG
jgi:hypothetical protein